MSTVSTNQSEQNTESLNFSFYNNCSQYCETFTKAIIGHSQLSIGNPNQNNIVLIAEMNNGQENRTIMLENIILQLGLEYQKMNEYIFMNLSLFEKWKDKIEQLFFHPQTIIEQLYQCQLICRIIQV